MGCHDDEAEAGKSTIAATAPVRSRRHDGEKSNKGDGSDSNRLALFPHVEGKPRSPADQNPIYAARRVLTRLTGVRINRYGCSGEAHGEQKLNDASKQMATDAATTPPTLGPEIDNFIGHVESISDGFMLGMIIATQMLREKCVSDLDKFEKEFCKVSVNGQSRSVSVPVEKLEEWKKLSKRVKSATLSLVNLPRSTLVSLVSHFDAYVGRIIRTIYLRKPELLNTSDRKLSFEELTRFDTVAAVREFIIEKEVESVLRSSHVEQFKWMERIYSTPLTEGLDVWPAFVELTERRNLFVHTDGRVSSQYLAVCKKFGCDIPDEAKENKEEASLGVPQEYFESANNCAYEIGVKLGHVLWRKIFPDERYAADQHLIGTTYELLVSEKYKLATKILDFACNTLKTHSTEVFKLMLIVNRALAYKWSGNEKSAKHAMKGVDWLAKSDEFKLANAVINDDWNSAVKFMHRIGDTETVGKFGYRNWPLFKEWRKHPEFKKAYADIFKEDFEKAVEVDTKEEESLEAKFESEIRFAVEKLKALNKIEADQQADPEDAPTEN